MNNIFGKKCFPILAILLLIWSNLSPAVSYALDEVASSTSSSVLTSPASQDSPSSEDGPLSEETPASTTEEVVEVTEAATTEISASSEATGSEPVSEEKTDQVIQKTLNYEDEAVKASLTANFAAEHEAFQLLLPKVTSQEEWNSEREFVEQLHSHLAHEHLQVIDVQSIQVTHGPLAGDNEPVNLTLGFKSPLDLRGGPLMKDNLRLVSMTDGSPVFHQADFQFDEAGILTGLTYQGVLGKAVHLVTVKSLSESTSVELGQYARLELDGHVLSEVEGQPTTKLPLNARLTVKIYRSDVSSPLTVLSPIDSFREEATFDILSTWKDRFSLQKIESQQFDIVKIDYRQAHQSQKASLVDFKGDFAVSAFRQMTEQGEVKEDSNLLEVYLQSRKPAEAEIITEAPAPTVRSRGFSGFRSVGNTSTEQARVTQSKRIDYLGDGGNNPDTSVDDRVSSERHELYRLYLDMTGTKEPFDTIIVVDRSSSMEYEMSPTDSQPRYQAVYNALNGTRGRQGLLSKLVSFHPDNQVAIVGFQGYPGIPSGRNDADTILGWGRHSSVSMSQIKPPNRNGTNYTAGLDKAGELLEQNQSDRKKVMIFISDGVPTYANVEGTRYGTGFLTNGNPSYVRDWTLYHFGNWQPNYPKLPIYTLGISSQFGNSEDTSANPYVLNYMSEQTGGFYSHVADSQALERTLQKIVDDTKLSLVSINDQLSQYVSYYAKQPDVKVIQTHRQTGQVTTLYQNGAVTSQGTGILKSVTHTAVNAADSTGRVDLNFVDKFKIDDTYLYTISYNVQVTDRAYEEKRKSDYNSRGDTGTDYNGNRTSSGQAGFRSNKDASLTYIRNEQTHKHTYAHPVVQVDTRQFTLQKVDSKNTSLLLDKVGFELRLSDKKTVFDQGTTDSKGNLTFTGLRRAKTYYLYETKAKDGYGLPETPWTVEVAVDGTITVKDQLGTVVSKVGDQHRIVNHKLYQLPSTGGYGPAVYIMVGVMVTTTASYLFYDKRKRIA